MSFGLFFSVISAAGQLAAGQAAEEESKLTAFNEGTDKVLNQVATKQAMRARREEYDLATASNVAQFAAMGVDLRKDKSVGAFLDKQEEVLGEDLRRAQNQMRLESLRSDIAAKTELRRGRNARTASLFRAIGTVGEGYDAYRKTIT